MRYFIRSLKYFVALCVACIAAMALMFVTGWSALTFDQTMEVILHSNRYLMLFVAIVVLAALYPRFGFVVRDVEGDVEVNRQQIINAFEANGFVLHKEEDGVLTFRADGILRKTLLLFEDEITVSQYGQWIRLDGIRRGVARVQYRLGPYLRMSKYE